MKKYPSHGKTDAFLLDVFSQFRDIVIIIDVKLHYLPLKYGYVYSVKVSLKCKTFDMLYITWK